MADDDGLRLILSASAIGSLLAVLSVFDVSGSILVMR
jgi:hypothetical protein